MELYRNSGPFSLGSKDDRAMRVLVVDDERNQRETICRGLFLYGYECISVNDLEDAMQVLRGPDGESIEMLITDMTIPGANGCGLIDNIMGLRRNLPILVIAGLNRTAEIDRVRRRGIPILQKPFDPEHLHLLMQRMVSERTL